MIRRHQASPLLTGLTLPLPKSLAVQLTPFRLLLLGLAFFIVLIAAFPLLWMASTSLKPGAEVLAWPPYFLPNHPIRRVNGGEHRGPVRRCW